MSSSDARNSRPTPRAGSDIARYTICVVPSSIVPPMRSVSSPSIVRRSTRSGAPLFDSRRQHAALNADRQPRGAAGDRGGFPDARRAHVDAPRAEVGADRCERCVVRGVAVLAGVAAILRFALDGRERRRNDEQFSGDRGDAGAFHLCRERQQTLAGQRRIARADEIQVSGEASVVDGACSQQLRFEHLVGGPHVERGRGDREFRQRRGRKARVRVELLR